MSVSRVRVHGAGRSQRSDKSVPVASASVTPCGRHVMTPRHSFGASPGAGTSVARHAPGDASRSARHPGGHASRSPSRKPADIGPADQDRRARAPGRRQRRRSVQFNARRSRIRSAHPIFRNGPGRAGPGRAGGAGWAGWAGGPSQPARQAGQAGRIAPERIRRRSRGGAQRAFGPAADSIGRAIIAAPMTRAGATPAATTSRGAPARKNPAPRPTELAASQRSVESGNAWSGFVARLKLPPVCVPVVWCGQRSSQRRDRRSRMHRTRAERRATAVSGAAGMASVPGMGAARASRSSWFFPRRPCLHGSSVRCGHVPRADRPTTRTQRAASGPG
jgi:hypothetical protein